MCKKIGFTITTYLQLGRRKAYLYYRTLINVGERNCAFEGCNALEFRETGYCLSHKGGLPNDKITFSASPAIGIPYENDGRGLMERALLLPIIALGYVPFVIFLLILISSGSDPFAGYYFFIYSGMSLVILLPFYSVFLVFLTWKRYKDGTLTVFVSIIHFLSFLVPFLYLLMFSTFNGSPA